MITVVNKPIQKDAEFILVSNYFVGERNEIFNWYFNKEKIKIATGCFDIGVWKIKQLKQ